MTGGLLAQHQQLVDASAINAYTALQRGYRSVQIKAELQALGFSKPQCRVPALLIPIRGVTGGIVNYQIRPDQPRVVNGKAIKYETPKGSSMVLDVPPAAHERLGDPKCPLFITEGARKADAGVSAGLCTIALLGVWNWRGTNKLGGKTALADWEAIALNGREVVIVFDSDVMTKTAVHAALARLKALLEQRGAKVKVIYLPSADSGTKVGLDDFLASGRSKDDVLALATTELRRPPEDAQERHSPYEESSDGIVWNKPSGDGAVPLTLTNFKARILAEVIEDDGAETKRSFEIEALVHGARSTFSVPADCFCAMNWPIEHLGASAIVVAGMGIKDRLREAIQVLSPQPIQRHHIYTHTGFKRISGQWVYLHAGGGIGENGIVEGVQVQLEAPLDRFILPPPPTGAECIRAVQQSLGLLDGLASDKTMFPLFSAAYLAPLGNTSESVFLFGKTGVRKSELAALIQRHYGAGMDAEHLPGSFTSTANSLEVLAFLGKDAVLVVDDFNPIGSVQDVRRKHADADRVFRAQGNHQARQRLRPDGTPRPPKPPRGLMLGTGEDVPGGHSVRARMFLVEIGEGEVNLDRLTQCQAAGTEYSRALAAYLQWLAPRREAVAQERNAFIVEHRKSLVDFTPHGRTATIALDLLFGLVCALRFARDCGAMDQPTEASLLQRGRCAILGSAIDQEDHHAASDPVKLFSELLADALQSGRVHMADTATGGVPAEEEYARLLGWQCVMGVDSTAPSWRSGGKLVGWADTAAQSIYLLPQAAYEAAQEMALHSPAGITVGQRMLAKRLDESGVLVSKDGDGRRTKKVRIAGLPRSVWHTHLDYIFSEEGTPGTERTRRSSEALRRMSFPEGVPVSPSTDSAAGTANGNGRPPARDVGSCSPSVPAVPPPPEEERAPQQGILYTGGGLGDPEDSDSVGA